MNRFSVVMAVSVASIGMTSISTAQTPASRPNTNYAGFQAASDAKEASPGRTYLMNARQALTYLTELPAAAQLTGVSRLEVQAVLWNFNELLSAKNDWVREFAEVRRAIDRVLGPELPPAAKDEAPGVVSPSLPPLDDEIRSRLEQARAQLSAFYAAAGSPRLPAVSEHPASMTLLASSASHLDGIGGILDVASGKRPKPGVITLDAAQVEEIRNHLEQLRQLVARE